MKRGCFVKDVLSITKLNTFFRRDFPDGYVFKGEYHDFYEIVCVLSGEIIVTADKEVYTLKTGEMTYHRPCEFHAFREESNSHPNVAIITFHATSFPEVNGKIFTLSEHHLLEIEDFFKSLMKIFELEPPSDDGKRTWLASVKPGEEISASALIKRLELLLISAFQKKANEKERLKNTKASLSYYKILTVMEENISNALSVEEIAKECGISVPTLEKNIHQFLGYGAMTHYNTLKMQKSYEMLLKGMSVKEVALKLGFLNQNYFSARFKKHYGFPPSQVGAASI